MIEDFNPTVLLPRYALKKFQKYMNLQLLNKISKLYKAHDQTLFMALKDNAAQ